MAEVGYTIGGICLVAAAAGFVYLAQKDFQVASNIKSSRDVVPAQETISLSSLSQEDYQKYQDCIYSLATNGVDRTNALDRTKLSGLEE